MNNIRSMLRFIAVPALIVGVEIAAVQAATQTPSELVRETVQKELNAPDNGASYMFKSRKETPRGSQTKLLVETKEGMAGMVIAFNDQPLTPEQRQGEVGHLDYIATHPEELRRKQRQEQDDGDRIRRILRAMPDAFLYESDGTETGRPGIGKPGAELVRLKFRPNPKYDPPTRVEQVLTGMQGQILIDPVRNRIAKIDGTLFRDVGFGWGILGHLDKGGRFQVEQGTVNADYWTMTRLALDFTGKVLLFRNIAIKSNEVFSDFQQVAPNLSFAEGAKILKKQIPNQTDVTNVSTGKQP